ncbi:MAG: hypothetical protein IJ223_06810 [Clostridia bacterium]|nr:hypothetical protein [Clostridia bacterium]
MNVIESFFREIKLKKEIKKHDKSYIKRKYIIGYDEKTGLPYYSFKKQKKY